MQKFSLLPILILLSAFVNAQNPILSIPTQGGQYIEGTGLCFSVRLTNPSPNETRVVVGIDPSSTATPGADFILQPDTVVFPAGFEGDQTACVISLNDTLKEPLETLLLELQNPTNNAAINNGTIAFQFYDNDSITTTLPCQRPFFSEYIHALAQGGARAVEIYNPSNTPADLSRYNIRIYYNGDSTAGNTIQLSGALLPGEVFVAAFDQSHPDVLAQADLLSPLLNWTGDDAVALFEGDQLVDIIGIPGEDPGSSWPAGTKFTSSAVQVRDSVIRQGETGWPTSAAHWTSYDQTDFTHLGSHFMLPCDPSGGVPPIISVITNDAAFPESIGALGILVTLYYPKDTETTVDIIAAGTSTATEGDDFSIETPTVVFPPNFTGSQSVIISIANDMLDEDDETVVLQLSNPNNNAILLDSVWVLTIQDDDPTVGVFQARNAPSLSLFPNPASAGAEINVALPEPGTINLFDMQKRLVRNYGYFSDTATGTLRLQLPDHLPAGQYLLRLSGQHNARFGIISVQ